MEETRTYLFTGNKKLLDKLESMFKLMNFCGFEGTSVEFIVFWDGDGEARMEVKRADIPKDFNTLEVSDEVMELLDKFEENEIVFNFE